MTLIQSCGSRIKQYQIPITQVSEEPASYIGKKMLWGGTVKEVDREQENVIITIDKKPLDKKGKPIETITADGKFLTRCSKDLKADGKWIDREITVLGRFNNEFRKVSDNESVNITVLNCAKVYLWEGSSFKVWSDHHRGKFPPFLDNPKFIFNGLIK